MTRHALPALAMAAAAMIGGTFASACGHDEHRATEATAARAEAPAKPEHGTVVQSPGKGGAPVDLSWYVDGKPLPGAPLAVDLDLRPRAPVSAVQLEVLPGKGLEAVSGHGDIPLTALSRAGGYEHRVVVVPQGDGLAYVHVIATVDTAAGRQVRSFAVPVTVGDGVSEAKKRAAGRIETDADGERVMVMPATEDAGS